MDDINHMLNNGFRYVLKNGTLELHQEKKQFYVFCVAPSDKAQEIVMDMMLNEGNRIIGQRTRILQAKITVTGNTSQKFPISRMPLVYM